MFKVGDWIVYKEDWPRSRVNKVYVVREVSSHHASDSSLFVDALDGNGPHWIHADAFRLHLGEGDIDPWSVEEILGIAWSHPDLHNLQVQTYWDMKIDNLCFDWLEDPSWDLEDTPGFEWARERLLEFRRERKAEREAERQTDLLAMANRLGVPDNLKLADYVLSLQREISILRTEISRLRNS